MRKLVTFPEELKVTEQGLETSRRQNWNSCCMRIMLDFSEEDLRFYPTAVKVNPFFGKDCVRLHNCYGA